MKVQVILFKLFVLVTTIQAYSQDFETMTHSDQFIRNCVIEVFQDKANVVFDSESKRYEIIKNFFTHQVSVEHRPEYAGKKFESTNNLALQNKNNPNLKRDVMYVQNTFNPLKYNITMNPTKRLMYRIGKSDYIMIISQSK